MLGWRVFLVRLRSELGGSLVPAVPAAAAAAAAAEAGLAFAAPVRFATLAKAMLSRGASGAALRAPDS